MEGPSDQWIFIHPTLSLSHSVASFRTLTYQNLSNISSISSFWASKSVITRSKSFLCAITSFVTFRIFSFWTSRSFIACFRSLESLFMVIMIRIVWKSKRQTMIRLARMAHSVSPAPKSVPERPRRRRKSIIAVVRSFLESVCCVASLMFRRLEDEMLLDWRCFGQDAKVFR